MERTARRMAAEAVPVLLVLAAVAVAWWVVVTMHRRHAPRKPAPAVVVAPAPRPAPAPKATEPPPAPPEDLTPRELAQIAALEAEQRRAAEDADRRAEALDASRRAVEVRATSLRRREMLVHGQVKKLDDLTRQLETAVDELDQQRDVLVRRRDQMQQELIVARARARDGYAILPYKGPNGTWRRPIPIECRNGAATIQPGGPTFNLLELSASALGLHATPLIEVVARLAARAEGSRSPDGKPIVPYILFIVRPDGIRPYYESRAQLERLGIAFGYELVDQDWPIEFPNLDDPAEWSDTPPLPSDRSALPDDLTATPPERSGHGGRLDPEPKDFLWKSQDPAGPYTGPGRRGPHPGPVPEGDSDSDGGAERGPARGDGLTETDGPDTGPGGARRIGPIGEIFGADGLPGRPGRPGGPGREQIGPPGGGPAPAGAGVPRGSGLPGDVVVRPGGTGLHGAGGTGPGGGPGDVVVPPAGAGSALGALDTPGGAGHGLSEGPLSDPPGTAQAGSTETSSGSGHGDQPARGRLPGSARGTGTLAQAAAGRAAVLDPKILDSLQPGSGPGREPALDPRVAELLEPGDRSGPGGRGAASGGQRTAPGTSSSSGGALSPSSSGGGSSGGVSLSSAAPGGPAGGSGVGLGGKPGAAGGGGLGDPSVSIRPEPVLELVVVCGAQGVLIHPGGYRLSLANLEPKEGRLAETLQAIVRRRQAQHPEATFRPRLKFVVEVGGQEAFGKARRQTILSGLNWPVTLQVAEGDVARSFGEVER